MKANQKHQAHRARRHRAAVLLEVVLAMSLFFMTTAFVLTGLNTSMQAVHNAKLDANAANLAVTVLSQVQMGLIPMVDTGPEAFDQVDREAWTWQIVVTPLQDRQDLPQLKQIEIIIRNDQQNFTIRESQMMWENPAMYADPNAQQIPGDIPTIPGGGLPGGLP